MLKWRPNICSGISKLTIHIRSGESEIYRGYRQTNDENVHDRIGYSQRFLIVQTVRAVGYKVHHRTPFLGHMASAVEKKQEEGDRP